MSTPHFFGAFTTALIHGVIVLIALGFASPGGCDSDDTSGGKLKMTTIEAALAYKSTTKSKQPQKRRKRPKARVKTKAAGVSRDDEKKVDPKKVKKTEETKKEDFASDVDQYIKQRQRDDEEDEEDELEDEEEGQEERTGGQFDGSEHGFAEVSKGDPYMQELAKDMYSSWEVPTLEKGSGSAVGCARLGPDGKIIDIKLETKSGNSNIDRSVKVALEKLQKKRNKKPEKVPRHLMDITTQWTCFKLKV